MKRKYIERVNDFFEYTDKHNCERLLNEVYKKQQKKHTTLWCVFFGDPYGNPSRRNEKVHWTFSTRCLSLSLRLLLLLFESPAPLIKSGD